MPFNTEKSAELHKRAYQVIPAGVNSNTRVRKPYPYYFRRARGAEVWDVDDNRYLDLIMGNGAVILGHSDSRVQDAVARVLDTGLTIGVEWEGAVEVAEQFLRIVRTMDLVRFSNTGTEAMMHALHVARHATGRVGVAKAEGSYHGWSDEVFVSAWPDVNRIGSLDAPISLAGSAGLHPDAVNSVLVLPFNDIARTRALIEEHAHELAAVIVEPVLIDIGYIPATGEYLHALRQICTEHGIVLIFDELLTGFRLAPGGAQEYYDVVPDLATYGKALANGYPIAALAGCEELMRLTEPGNGPAFVGTFNGHAVSVAAASATLPLLADGSLQRTLAVRTERLRRAFTEAAESLGIGAQLCGGGGHLQWYFTAVPIRDYRSAATTDARLYATFVAALAKCRILVGSNPLSHQAISLAHDEHVLEELELAFHSGLEAVANTKSAGQD